MIEALVVGAFVLLFAGFGIYSRSQLIKLGEARREIKELKNTIEQMEMQRDRQNQPKPTLDESSRAALRMSGKYRTSGR